ncbi:hypothetical protein [Planotetraspora mira]|uniref:Uncharacterized protein n=1 Tax=Planotetraspora mira TaxID=58121 RepID=A0A8J3TXB4_9ACTN|nr:hypothetical protein [Planotetraspora mira]GII33042.1 hypothetical protein Pmi06nite_64840 [Planotetraspora mira]
MPRWHDGSDPEQVLAPELPAPVTFEPNKAYLRELIATQIDYTTIGTGYVQDAHTLRHDGRGCSNRGLRWLRPPCSRR